MLDLIYKFFGSWRFPVFLLTVIVGYECVLLWLLFAPVSSDAATFANEFRIWCFGYDPATGATHGVAVFTTFTSPLVMVAVVLTVWMRQLKNVLGKTPRRALPYGVAGLLVVATASAWFAGLDVPQRTGALPFPAKRIRTEVPAPAFELVDHTGATVRLADLRGKVVLLTAVYSTCGFT